MDDTFSLQRFVEAQDRGSTYAAAVAELRRGRKQTHWMWFVFPQVSGLGHSSTAQFYAISGLDEARAYLTHPVLGPRLREAAGVVAQLPGTDPVAVFGQVDAMKLRSSMTLFALAAPDEQVFRAVLEQYFGGEQDAQTVERCGALDLRQESGRSCGG